MNGRSAKGKAADKPGGRSSARNSLEPAKGKGSRKSLEPTKGRRSQESEKPLKNGRQGTLQKGLRVSKSTSCLADMAKAGNKRKADKHEGTPLLHLHVMSLIDLDWYNQTALMLFLKYQIRITKMSK